MGGRSGTFPLPTPPCNHPLAYTLGRRGTLRTHPTPLPTHASHTQLTEHTHSHTQKAPPFVPLVQVLLDKNPRLRTVVNKVGSIGNEYRVFDMELLAGEGDTVTEVRQHGLRFRLDFARVIEGGGGEGGRGDVFLFDMELT